MYGLQYHINYLPVSAIKAITEDDPSDGVRQVAQDLLKELEIQMCVARKITQENRNALRELAKKIELK